MEFEFYDGSKKFGNHAGHVKITGKHLVFTAAAVEKHLVPLLKKLKIKELTAVRIGYNKIHETIGFFPQQTAAATDIRPCKKKEGYSSLVFWVQGFVRQHGLERRMLNVEPVEGGLHLTAGEKLPEHKYKRKKSPPAPILGLPVTTSEGEPAAKKIDYACRKCGYSNVAWKHNKTLPKGYPDVCIKCDGTEFEPV